MEIQTKISPQNLLENWGNMEDWENGASAAPTGHTLAGASATVTRESTIVKQGDYSAKVTRVGNDATLYYDHPDYEDYQGRLVTFGCWVYATVASRARIGLSDGVASAQSSYHSGVAGWEYLEVSLNVAAAATRLRDEMQVNTGNTSGYFDGGILCEGDDTFVDLSDGSQFYISRVPSDKGIRISEYDPARRHGVILGQPRYDKQTVKLTGHVRGTTALAARTNFDAVKKAVLSLNELRADQGLRDLYFSDDRYLRGQPKNWSDDGGIAAKTVVNFDFDFVVPDPFDRHINWTRLVQAISSSPTSFDLAAGGTIYTKPVIYFITTGSNITSLTLENLTTGESVSYTGTVLNGDTLVMDCFNETIENDGVDDLANHVGDWLTLLPLTNKLKFTGSNCSIKIDYLKRYL